MHKANCRAAHRKGAARRRTSRRRSLSCRPHMSQYKIELPKSQGLGALLNLGAGINDQVQRQLLWHWRTVCRCFRVSL